jgi:hypothetical protein
VLISSRKTFREKIVNKLVKHHSWKDDGSGILRRHSFDYEETEEEKTWTERMKEEYTSRNSRENSKGNNLHFKS